MSAGELNNSGQKNEVEAGSDVVQPPRLTYQGTSGLIV